MTVSAELWPWNQTGFVVEVERRVVDESGDPPVDSHGIPTEDYSDPQVIPFAVFAPAPPSASQEPYAQGRPNLLVDLPVVYLPPGEDVSPLDRVIVNGVRYEVAGDPGRWDDPASGETFGWSLPLRRVAG